MGYICNRILASLKIETNSGTCYNGWTLRRSCLVKSASYRKTNNMILLMWGSKSRQNSATEADGGCQGQGREKWELLFKGHRVSVSQGDKVLANTLNTAELNP